MNSTMPPRIVERCLISLACFAGYVLLNRLWHADSRSSRERGLKGRDFIERAKSGNVETGLVEKLRRSAGDQRNHSDINQFRSLLPHRVDTQQSHIGPAKE